MGGQILVPLKRSDRVEEVIPYVEKIAKPGMRIVFLIPYPVESWLYLKDHWVTTESPRRAMLAGRKIMESHSWEIEKGLAEQRVSPAREALYKIGIEVGVVLYTGSLRKLVQAYKARGDVQWILMPARSGLRMMNLLQGAIPFLRLSKLPGSSPVLLLRPD